MPTADDRAKFWDERILDWEAARYAGAWRPALGPGEWLAGLLSGPTRLRQRLGVELLSPVIAGKEVVEVGCGSGLLAKRFLEAGAGGYLGLDHSSTAIAAARRRHANEGRIRFEVRAATELPRDRAVVVSLGLLDWLSDEELSVFFARHGAADFLHTFSESRPELKQLFHISCRAVARALRPEGVRPRYMPLAHLKSLLPPGRPEPFAHRDRALRYATFISSFPIRTR